MIELAVFLKRAGYAPRQVQDFIPGPMDIATCIYHTGIDPQTMERVFVARHLKDRGVQRALMQFFDPENHAVVKQALRRAGRGDLIGDGPGCLIPARPPRRREQKTTTRTGKGTPGYRRAARERRHSGKPHPSG